MEKFIYVVLLFFIYSFLGWLMEVIISLVKRHKFINRGFLIGPICPIYGIGANLITILLNQYSKEPITLFLMSVIICTTLEYFTSYIMEKIFKNRWWDYSQMKYNINGRVCLECSIPFGIGSCILFYCINPILFYGLNNINISILKIISIILLLILFIDIIISFRVICNLKNISNSIRCDSTEVITKKVKEILTTKDPLHRRLLASFPDMQVKNRLSILTDKIKNDKLKIKREKKMQKKRK
jgi:uncharacterized membrane protein